MKYAFVHFKVRDYQDWVILQYTSSYLKEKKMCFQNALIMQDTSSVEKLKEKRTYSCKTNTAKIYQYDSFDDLLSNHFQDFL